MSDSNLSTRHPLDMKSIHGPNYIAPTSEESVFGDAPNDPSFEQEEDDHSSTTLTRYDQSTPMKTDSIPQLDLFQQLQVISDQKGASGVETAPIGWEESTTENGLEVDDRKGGDEFDWEDPNRMNGYFESLGVGAGPAGPKTSQTSRKDPQFVVIIFDPIQCDLYHHGSIGGTRLAIALDRLARDTVESADPKSLGVSSLSDLECLIYLASCENRTVGSNDRVDTNQLEDFASGLQAKSPLGISFTLHDRKAYGDKIKALVEFHANSSSCVALILGSDMRDIGSAFATNLLIFDKLFYVEAKDLIKPVTSSAAGINQTATPPDSPPHQKGVSSNSSSTNPSPPHHSMHTGDHKPMSSSVNAGLENKPIHDRRTGSPVARYSTVNLHGPPPCRRHYLSVAGCGRGRACGYSHDCIRSEDEFANFKRSVRAIACQSVRKGSTWICEMGNDCIYGHVCPFDEECNDLERCYFNSQAHPQRINPKVRLGNRQVIAAAGPGNGPQNREVTASRSGLDQAVQGTSTGPSNRGRGGFSRGNGPSPGFGARGNFNNSHDNHSFNNNTNHRGSFNVARGQPLNFQYGGAGHRGRGGHGGGFQPAGSFNQNSFSALSHDQ